MKRRGTGQNWQDALTVVTQESRRGYGVAEARGSSPGRTYFLWVVFAVVVGVVVARLFYLQVFEGGSKYLLSQSNTVKVERERAPRGVIYDRNGKALVRNTPDEKYGVTRQYVIGPSAAHVVGYVAEVRGDELGCRGGLCYESGSLTGRAGIEQVMEEVLRGRDGGRVIEVNAKGEEVRMLGRYEPEAGGDVMLTIDYRLQQAIYEALEGKVGAVVASDMQGRVLGLVSSPSFDPNMFTVDPKPEVLKNMLEDKDAQYFLNRAIGGAYAPGSVYKLVTAYAGLESGKLSPERRIEDTGEIKIDQYRYGNWYFDQYGKTEGELDLVGALRRSNDIFFYRVGEEVGAEELASWSKRMGLGVKTGIELPGEVEGLVPFPLWRERYIGEKWFLGNTYHMAIGQGDLLTTPVQIARMTVAAVSGRICAVTLLGGREVDCHEIEVDGRNIEVVREGMKQACAPGGTAFPFFDFEPYVLCKTGTAQHGGEKTLPHAWITVAYPGENPEMVVTVILEAAGEGSYEAGPVAKKIVEEYKKFKIEN